MLPFQCWCDTDGNITVADGFVCQIKSGVFLPVGSGSSFDVERSVRSSPDWTRFPYSGTGTFIGGSGRNLISSGLPMPLSGPTPPVGIFRPGRPWVFTLGGFTLDIASDTGSATIRDASNVIAAVIGSAFNGAGTYYSTSYGQSVFNGGAPFTLTLDQEVPGGMPVPGCEIIQSGMFFPCPDATFNAVDSVNYVLAADSDWSILVRADGTADLSYDGTCMARRDSGSNCGPGGRYDSTPYGTVAYNDGTPWSVVIRSIPQKPCAGFVYVKVTTESGVLGSAGGPFFSPELPASSGELFHRKIAESDGIAFEQIHTGLLIWPEAGGGGESIGKTWIRISRTAFAALTTEERNDPDKIYNVYRD